MQKNYIFYDLETNGLDYYTTGIMQITILDKNSAVLLNQYVYPYDNRIDGTQIHGINKQTLIDNNAISTSELCILIKKILRDKFDREDIYFVAYNNFGYDQIILENNFKISNIKVPINWYFIDLYPVVKELYTEIKPNYKLKTVFENLCDNNGTIQYHCSFADTQCLYKIFKKVENEISILNKYTRPLLQSTKIFDYSINALIGHYKGTIFTYKNINVIGDLYNIYKMNNYDKKLFEEHLRINVGIYSNFYINNVIRQIEIIHYLQ